MERIIRGIHQFQKDIFSSQKELFERLATGQTPDALFITCSDSRINPNLVTQTKPGDLFIMRNAGNIIPPFGAANGGEGATIEYAVAALGIKDIIVCGHTHCGAMKGLLNLDKLTSMPSVVSWLQHAEATRRIIEEKYGDDSDDDRLTDTIKENVLVQLKNLETHPVVAAGMSTGRLKLHGWVYEFETGKIYSYDLAQGKFVSLTGAIVEPVQDAQAKEA